MYPLISISCPKFLNLLLQFFKCPFNPKVMHLDWYYIYHPNAMYLYQSAWWFIVHDSLGMRQALWKPKIFRGCFLAISRQCHSNRPIHILCTTTCIQTLNILLRIIGRYFTTHTRSLDILTWIFTYQSVLMRQCYWLFL